MANVTKLRVVFRAWINGDARVFEARGRVAQSLVALQAAQDGGITAAELSNWAYRLGAYVHVLRQDYGLDIATQREEHYGGWHGRYVLVTPVEILELNKT